MAYFLDQFFAFEKDHCSLIDGHYFTKAVSSLLKQEYPWWHMKFLQLKH